MIAGLFEFFTSEFVIQTIFRLVGSCIYASLHQNSCHIGAVNFIFNTSEILLTAL